VTDPRRTRSVRWPTLLLATLLLTVGLTSCSSEKSYCAALKDDQKQLKKLTAESAKSKTTGAKALESTVELLSGLREKAPDDIEGDWETLVEALRGLADAVKASGASPSDFGSGKRPSGVTAGQYAAVTQAAAELQTTPVQQAGKSIEQHAQDVCKVDLGAGLGGAG
jgi:hypothetical protein